MTDQPSTYPTPAPVATSSLPVTGGLSARAERAMSGMRFRPFLTVLGLVMVLAGIYYAFVATPLYVSETKFAIRSQSASGGGGSSGGTGGGGGLGGLGGVSAQLSEITSVYEYIRSNDMLKILDARHDLRSKYSQPRLDPFRRMEPDASTEKFLAFYRKMIVVQLDREADIVTVRVRGFDRETAHAVARSILGLTEGFVDGQSTRLRREALASAQQELELAASQVQQSRAAVASFRSVSDDVNPEATGSQAVGEVSSLEAQASAIQAELNALRTYSQPGTPMIRQSEARLATINRQIAAARADQGGSGGQTAGSTGGLSQRVTQYEALIAQRTAAEEKLNLAQGSYDGARTAAQQREKYVVPITQANLPQDSTEPRRLADFLMVLLFAAAAYAIITLALAGIRDHQGI